MAEMFRQFLLGEINNKKIDILILSLFLGLIIFIFIRFFIYGEGIDLFLRQAEALYFLKGINPYRVLIKEIPEIKEIGRTDAYPPTGYIYAVIFYSWNNGLLTKIVHFILDITYLIGSIIVWKKIIRESGLSLSNRSVLISLIALLVSPFFWMQISSGNYNTIALFSESIIIYGIINKKSTLLTIGLILLSIKPSFGIPFYLFCLLEKKYKEIIIASVVVVMIVLFCSFWLKENPFTLILQTLLTMKRYTYVITGGILVFLRPFLEQSTISIISLISFLLISSFIFYIKHQMNWSTIHLSLYFIVSPIVFFYNHSPSWITTFPLILLSIALFLNKNEKVFLYIFLLLSFLIIPPKLYGIFRSDLYIYIHNFLRLGSWLALSFIIPYLWMIIENKRK